MLSEFEQPMVDRSVPETPDHSPARLLAGAGRGCSRDREPDNAHRWRPVPDWPRSLAGVCRRPLGFVGRQHRLFPHAVFDREPRLSTALDRACSRNQQHFQLEVMTVLMNLERKQSVTADQIKQVLADHAIGLNKQHLLANTDVTWIPDNNPGDVVQIQAQYNFQSVTGSLVISGIPLRTTTRMVIVN